MSLDAEKPLVVSWVRSMAVHGDVQLPDGKTIILKNIQVIDSALNCTYSVFRVSEDDFALIFPGAGQDIEFSEDLFGRLDSDAEALLSERLFQHLCMARAAELGGMDACFVAGVQPTPPRLELVSCRGEPLLVSWYAHDDGEAVRAITRLEVSDGRISLLRNYFFTPDIIKDVCGELGLPFRSNGYHWWLPPR